MHLASPLRPLLLVALLLLCVPLCATPDLTPRIAAMLREQGLAGAVWTTLEAHGAAGVSDVRGGTPMRVDQRVHVGSIAKTLLAIGVLRLVSERRLALDAPLATILPGIALDNPWVASDPVRIRHLLDHTAGLDDARLWHVFSMQAEPDAPLVAAFPPHNGLLRSRNRPGDRSSYSNVGYTLLGMVIEAVVQQRYETYLDAALLAPLRMHDSSFGFTTQRTDSRLAMGHFERGMAQPALASYVRPAGQFTTTAADMASLARFLMGDGSVNGRPFIEPALLRQLGEPSGTEAARAGLQTGFGLGLRKLDRHGVLAKCHGGNAIGFRANLCLFPMTKQAFFIAFNADSETADYQSFDALLVRALLPPTPMPASASTTTDRSAWTGYYVPAPSRFDSLRLLDTMFQFMRVEEVRHGLRVNPFQGPVLELVSNGHSLFRASGKLVASHVLLIADDGARVLSTGTQSYVRVPPAYLFGLWASAVAGIMGFAAILIGGAGKYLSRRLTRTDPVFGPLTGVLLLLLPLPFFLGQSFLQLGEVTVASALLALVTAVLPVTMLIGVAQALRRSTRRLVGSVAPLAVLLWTAVLAAWGLLPLRLWV